MGLTTVYVEATGIIEDSGTMDWAEFCAWTNDTNVRVNQAMIANNVTDIENHSYTKCEDCKDNGDALFVTVIVTVLSKVGQLTTDLTRSHGPYDVACQKVFGALVPIFGLITSVIALRAYDAACYEAIPKGIGGVETNPERGIGYIFEMLVTILGVIDIIGHIIVPLPEEGDDNYKKPYW